MTSTVSSMTDLDSGFSLELYQVRFSATERFV